MNNTEFSNEIYNSYKRSVKVLQEKEEEYSSEGNRLSQFYEVSELADCYPCEALIGMAAKHFTSIMHMVKDPHSYSLDQWDEKLTDLRNYTFLLDALLRDMGIE